jgi:hypothetical protein
MDLLSLLLVAAVLVPAIGLATWTWFTVVRIDEDLRAFEGHKGMDFGI